MYPKKKHANFAQSMQYAYVAQLISIPLGCSLGVACSAIAAAACALGSSNRTFLVLLNYYNIKKVGLLFWGLHDHSSISTAIRKPAAHKLRRHTG